MPKKQPQLAKLTRPRLHKAVVPFHNFSELRKAMSAVLVEDISRKGTGQ